MLQEKYLPVADVSKVELIDIQAPLSKVYPIVAELNFEESRIIYWLFKLRGMPVPGSLSLQGLEKINFIRLETVHGREMIIGLIGQFWTPSGKHRKFKPEEFIPFVESDFAKATWSFELQARNETSTRLITETRVFCLSPETRKKFKRYWTVIQPFSTWIRLEILKAIKKRAENIKLR